TNEQHKLKPEMFARLHIQVGDASAFLTVPKEAVLEVDGKHFVYVVEGEGKYLKREVKIATASGDQVRVVDGLKPGERIVTKGAVLVKGQESKG
ncbi:MAG: efflux RND transporter periplasmic adaptor subunit, partial [Nitrospirota bacterium]|nr:efflux RND transporter periplasmic adaptor subunit [Nitrospirota bacterium]